ncbi:MAG: NAD(+) diphosphatase [Cumulibacter sp.]
MRRVNPLFGEFAHERDAEHRKDDGWLREAYPRGQILVLTERFEAPIDESSGTPRLAWRPAADVKGEQQPVYLGSYEDRPHFMVMGRRDLKADMWMDLRAIGGDLSIADRGLYVEAVAIAQWHARHTQCPQCGGRTRWRDGGWSTECENDGSLHFPRTDPAVIMLVHDGADKIVLGRQAAWPEGRFSVLAGFVEPGETLEAAVSREVKEEVGIDATDVEYAGSQPWPFPCSVMLGFSALADSTHPLQLMDGEIAEASWFTRDEVRSMYGWDDEGARRPGARSMPGSISIAHHLIKAWVDGDIGAPQS